VHKKQLAFAGSVKSSLENVSEADARLIGSYLSPALRQRKTPEAGVYQWKNQNLSMVELFDKEPWFEAMFITVAEEILKTAPWGMVWRVTTGATLSILDMVSDINITQIYLRKPELRNYGLVLLGMLLLSMSMQLIMSACLHRKAGARVVLLDCLAVITGMKPAVNAYNVATSKKKSDKSVFEPKLELVASKIVEIFSESIPGCLLQTYGERVCERASVRASERALGAACEGFYGRGVPPPNSPFACPHLPRKRSVSSSDTL
jgi:hypothetical protein